MAPRVLQVIPQLDTGGAERTTLDVAEALVAAGGAAWVFTEPGGRLEPELRALGGHVEPGPAAAKHLWTVLMSNVSRIEAVVRRERLQLIHARSRAPAWSALRAARRLGLPFVTTYHGIYNARSGLKRWYNSVMARGDLIIANSQYTGEHLQREHGVDPARVRVIPRGVDLARFDPATVDEGRTAALLQAWRLPAQRVRPLVLLPARLTAWKGQRVLIDALGLLKVRGVDLDLVLAGDDQGRSAYAQGLRDQAQRLGLAGQVHLVGHCADVPAAMWLADIVACPSTEPEAFGRTAAEAQAMARPVIASNIGGARETVEAGRTGLLVPPSDPTALAAALASLLEAGAEARARMGSAGQARVRALFSKSALQRSTLAVYGELLTPSGHAA